MFERKTREPIRGGRLYTVLVSPRLVPYRMTDGLKEKTRGRIEELVGSGWLAIGRVLELFGLTASLWLLLRGDEQSPRVAIASLLLTGNYVTPYILGFGYERHFSIFVMLVSICCLFLFSELVRSAPKRNPSAIYEAGASRFQPLVIWRTYLFSTGRVRPTARQHRPRTHGRFQEGRDICAAMLRDAFGFDAWKCLFHSSSSRR